MIGFTEKMGNVRRVLEHSMASPHCHQFPIRWSDQRKDTLARIASAEIPVRTPIDVSLALPLLQCANGDFVRAEQTIIELLKNNLGKLNIDNEMFISFIPSVALSRL